MTGPASSRDNAVARFDGGTGKIVQSSNALLDDADRFFGARTFEFIGEFRNPTTGATAIINLGNGQKQWVPVGTATSIVLTGPTGPGNFQLRFYHYRASALLNWPTGGSAAPFWPGASMVRGSVASGARSIVSIFAVGATGPDANEYYAQGVSDFRRT